MECYRSLIGTSLLAVSALNIPAYAQAPADRPTPQPAPAGASVQADRQGELTATGCLQLSDAASSVNPSGATAPGSPSGPAGASGGFVLKHASVGSGGMPSSTPTDREKAASSEKPSPGESGSAAGRTTAHDIQVTAGAGVNLEEHVGHEVEVKGRFAVSHPAGASRPDPANPSPGAPGSRPPAASEPAAGQAGSSLPRPDRDQIGQLLIVTSIRMVAPTCTAGAR